LLIFLAALEEIRKYQKGDELLLKKLPFARLCKEICQDSLKHNPVCFFLFFILTVGVCSGGQT
jgi:hypothetical protein